jgi:hypothetical protein
MLRCRAVLYTRGPADISAVMPAGRTISDFGRPRRHTINPTEPLSISASANTLCEAAAPAINTRAAQLHIACRPHERQPHAAHHGTSLIFCSATKPPPSRPTTHLLICFAPANAFRACCCAIALNLSNARAFHYI